MKTVLIAGRMGTGKDTVSEILAKHGWERVALADRIKQHCHALFGFSRETLFGPSAKRNEIQDWPDFVWEEVFYRGGHLIEEIWMTLAAGSSAYRMCKERFTQEDVSRELLTFLKNCRRQAHEGKFSARYALQQMGTEFGRAMRDDVWIVAAEFAIDQLRRGYAYDPLTGVDFESYGKKPVPVGVVITDCRFPNEARHFKSIGAKVYWIDASRRLETPPSTHASEPDMPAFDGLLDGVLDNNDTVRELAERVIEVTQ